MSILRKKSKSGWTTINNDVLEDNSLSFRARGLAAYLISKPDDWVIKMAHIIREGAEGEKAIRTALHELAEAGYLIRSREQINGQITTVTTIADYPAFLNEGTPEQRINGYTKSAVPDLTISDRSGNGHVRKGEVLVNTESPIDDDEESTNYWTQPRQPLTRKAGRKYPAEEGTTDASAILVSHMQSLIEQPNGLLRKYKEAAGVSELGASDIATITAWIDFYQAKEAAGMEHTLACKLAYGAIRDANPAPVQTEPATVADKLLEQATQVASAWTNFLENPNSVLENKRQPRRRETDEENHFAV